MASMCEELRTLLEGKGVHADVIKWMDENGIQTIEVQKLSGTPHIMFCFSDMYGTSKTYLANSYCFRLLSAQEVVVLFFLRTQGHGPMQVFRFVLFVCVFFLVICIIV